MHNRDAQQSDGGERLLAAARRLFARRGFSGVSVEDLVQAAAVTRPVLYYHFHSKEGLYAAARQRAVAEYEAALERAATGEGSVMERVRRVCEAHALASWESSLLADPSAPAFDARGAGSTRLRKGARLSRVVEVLRKLIAEGVRSAELGECDPESAAIALAGAAAAAAWLAGGGEGFQARESVAPVVEAVFLGLRPGVAA